MLRAFLPPLLIALVAAVAWSVLVVFGTLNGWTRSSLAPRGDADAFARAAREMIDRETREPVAFRLLRHGQVHAEYYAPASQAVNADTVFQTASLSKWLTAWGVLTLVEAGKLDLDAPLNRYLTRWKLHGGQFDAEAVTARRLLTHTAGLGDGLGYAGFDLATPLQTLEESLTRASDASAPADGRTFLEMEPGAGWKYSGGGYTILQLLIEEISGERFSTYMQRAVFAPLGLSRTTHTIDPATATNVASLYDAGGQPLPHRHFTAQAAASLYTSAADLTRFLQAHLPGPQDLPPGRGVLKPETLRLMREPHVWQMGAAIWGLGTILYAPTANDAFIVGHDGKRAPGINSAARFDPTTGDGIIVLVAGHPMLATRLAGEWVFWQTGQLDLFMFTMALSRVFIAVVAGCVVIVVGAAIIGWNRHRRFQKVINPGA